MEYLRRRILPVAAVLLAAFSLTACATPPPTADSVPTLAEPTTPATSETTTDRPWALNTDHDPTTFVGLILTDPTTLDPALAYDLNSGYVIENVLEGLLAYDPTDADGLLPVLATAVPDATNGLISADGLTYTFPIRSGVSFHDGGAMTPSDVAYSIQRGLLQSDPTGPQWLLIEPIMGYESGDITESIADGAYAADPVALRANATSEELLAVCRMVQAAVTADDAANVVTVRLAKPWGPFLSTVAGFVRIIDQQWAVAQGDWDGDCATWQDHYAPGPEGSTLSSRINGTGPYRLDHWTRGEEFVLTAFDGYWRTDGTEVFAGGPSGVARIPTAVFKVTEEWGTRLAALRAGDADFVVVPGEHEEQVESLVGEDCDYATGACIPRPENPDGFLRKWDNLPSTNRADIFMNFNVAPDSAYIGSGALDGDGITPYFFSDINVRRAMATCFDYETYIADVQLGKGWRNNGPIIRDLLGYNDDGPQYSYDLAACADYLASAWDGVLPDTGFRFTFVYPEAIPGGSSAAEILRSGLSAVNDQYEMELLGLPFPVFFEAFDSGQLPAVFSGWFEDVHDPHFWAQPFTIGSYGAFQNMPDDLQAQFADLVKAGVNTTDPTARERAYFALQQLFYDEVPTVILSQRPNFRYEPRWIEGFTYRPGMDPNNPPLYLLGLSGE
jgi:peptide/nickel transport system substrate-binding protein